MSAPNQGRQSPDPETQTGAQQKDAPGSGKQEQQGNIDNKATLKGMQSNPTHVLEKSAEEKTSKGS
jgi:hypothetical protein